MTLRLVLIVPLTVAAWTVAPVAQSFAAPGCTPGGTPPPVGASMRQVNDLDGDGRPDTLWIASFRAADGATKRVVGVTTASGANTALQISSASPIPLRALAIDAQNDGDHQVIVSDCRGAHLYVFADCRLETVIESGGTPFVFDLKNLRDQGTGIGCSDLGDGRRLVGLQALDSSGQWTVRRTQVELNGIHATTGRSDTVTAISAQDPIVTSAETISCGDLTIDQDGVQQP